MKELQQHQPQCRVYIVLTKCDLLPETPSQLPARVSEALPPQPEPSNDRVGSTEAHIAPPPAPVQLLEQADRFDYDSKGMAFNRMKASPTNVLDRTSSSYGSTTSRSQNEGKYFAAPLDKACDVTSQRLQGLQKMLSSHATQPSQQHSC